MSTNKVFSIQRLLEFHSVTILKLNFQIDIIFFVGSSCIIISMLFLCMRLNENKFLSHHRIPCIFEFDSPDWFFICCQTIFKYLHNSYVPMYFFMTINNVLLGISSFLGILYNLALCASIVWISEIKWKTESQKKSIFFLTNVIEVRLGVFGHSCGPRSAWNFTVLHVSHFLYWH